MISHKMSSKKKLERNSNNLKAKLELIYYFF